MTTPIHCSFATDNQRFPRDPTPDPEPTYEVWHRTTSGTGVSSGFVDRGTGDRMIRMAQDLMRGLEILRAEDAITTHVGFYLVLTGSYEGYPEPALHRANEVDASGSRGAR